VTQVLIPIENGSLGLRLRRVRHLPWLKIISTHHVLSSKRIEGGSSNPFGTELFFLLFGLGSGDIGGHIATSVWTYHRNSEHVEVHNSGN